MARHIHVEPHLTVEELFARFRSARDGTATRRFQVVWLAASGKLSREITEATGYGRDWVFRIIKRYNEEGPGSLEDARSNNGGHGRVLTDEDIEALRERLETPPPDGGLWTSPKVAAWMTKRVGRPVDFKLAWDYLKRMGYTLQQPRPSHTKADPEAQDAFKKGGFVDLFSTSWHKEKVPASASGPKMKAASD